MLFDLKSYRKCIYPLWKQRKLLTVREELTDYEKQCWEHGKWLAFWALFIFALLMALFYGKMGW